MDCLLYDPDRIRISVSYRSKRLLLVTLGLAVAYFAVPAILLRYALDVFLFRPSIDGPTHEDRRVEISVGSGRSVIVRTYGIEPSRACLVFFPGQHGGITTAIKAAMRRNTFSSAWTMLPVTWLIRDDYRLVPLIKELDPTPVVLFHGTEDTVTPLADACRAFAGLGNVDFIGVENATHSNAFLVAGPIFAHKLSALLTNLGQPWRTEHNPC
jgi:hypothetical protein